MRHGVGGRGCGHLVFRARTGGKGCGGVPRCGARRAALGGRGRIFRSGGGAQRLEELTFPERDDLGAALCEGFAAAWAQGDASGYPAQLRARWNAAAYLADGSCAEAVREELLESTRTALVTLMPEPAREPEPTPEATPEPTEEPAKENPSVSPAASRHP